MYTGNPGTRIQVGAIEIEYEEHGGGDGRPFVLVHGFTGSRDDWREVLPRLAARGRTVAPDLRGHGGSTNPGESAAYSLDHLVGDVAGFLDALGIPRIDLLGHSMGGMVALRLALDQPERVASLVLMDTAAEAISRDARRFFEVSAKIAREQGMEALHQMARSAAERDPNRPASVRRYVERTGADRFWARIRAKQLSMDPEAFATLGPMLTDHQGVVDRLGEIRCPTTVLVGEDDRAFLKPAEVLARGIPGARHVVIEGAAHSPQLENQEAWLAAVLAHLERARAA
jgi:pimeloyl-ACP methyl ester carboxylesterase